MQDNTASISPHNKETVDALWRLQKIILDTLDFQQVVERIVNSLLTELGYLHLGYRILVLTLADPKHHVLKRIALSATEEAQQALNASAIPFEKIEIPLDAEDNLLIKVLHEKKPFVTHYWPDIFRPILTDEQALANQTAAGIQTSMLYPLLVKEEAIGVLIFSMIKSEAEVTDQEKDLIARFTDIVGLAVQNSILYTSLQEANERLKSVDLLKDEFLSLASHELRTPMTAIKNYSWMMREGQTGALNEKQKKYADRIFLSTERLIRLVNDMLNVSRIEAGRLTIDLKSVDLMRLAQDVMNEVLASAQNQHISIVLEPASLSPVLADEDKTKEVFINLIGNSLKFTPPGGRITISFEQKDGFILAHVADTGKGIKSEDMPKLFHKFGMIEGNYTYTTARQGTGLGLYLSKSIIELQGGEMSVFSEGENKGTTFTFSLKKAPETATQEKPVEHPAASANMTSPFPTPVQG